MASLGRIDLGELRESLERLKVDGWLLFDFHGSNPIARRVVDPGSGLGFTRRLFVWLPKTGAPTILGCWIGAFTYSQFWALLFLGIGAGAIVQVITAILGGRALRDTLAPLNLAGMLVGYLVMYGTGLLVGAA